MTLAAGDIKNGVYCMPRRKIEMICKDNECLIDLKTGQSAKISSLPVICERIRFYRENSGTEQKALAAMLGITPNSVSNWENGRSRPDVNLLPAICEALNITLYDLFGMDDPSVRNTLRQQQLIDGYEKLSDGHRLAVENMIDTLLKVEEAESCPDLSVLLYFNRSLAAGIGDPTEFEENAEPVYVYTTPESSRADSIFKINGDSMEPVYHDGQDVLVQRIIGHSELKFGEIGAFIVGNETYIKQYEKDGLHSLNPDYPVMHFEEEDAVFLIGRVTGVLNTYDYAKQADIEKYKLLHKI